MNILCLAALNQLGPLDETPSFLSYPRGKRVPVWKRPRKCRRGAPLSEEAREQKLAQVKAFNDSVKAKARATRVRNASHLHSGLVKKLSDPKFRALYILVARLFAHKLATDVHVLEQFEASKDKEERRTLSFQFSLAGKWAPTPGCSHDRHTNIATAIAALLHHTQSLGTPRVVVTPENETSELDTHILRSFYQRWVLSPLRKTTELPEPLMSAKRWTEIKYSRVASKCMQANMERFFTHDPIGFEKFLEGVESGKKKISGATLMPHQLLKDLLLTTHDLSESTRKESKKADIQRQIAEIKTRGIQAQWKTMVDRLRESGKLENSLAICDVSGSMGTINDVDEDSKYVSPILPAVSLSLVLAQLATPPFSNGFITFSANPEFVQLDPSLSLADTVHAMVRSSWGMNTNLEAVFLKLLLPLAVQNKVKPEDMVKRLFIFSDMQFDTSLTPYHGYSYSSEPINWETSHDVIEKAFKEAGYEMPEIVYWNLAMQYGTVPVTHDRKGVAIMSGFSASMMKVFLGEEEEEIVEEGWEDIKPEVEPKKEKEPESFDPMSVMKKVLSKRSYLGLVVVD